MFSQLPLVSVVMPVYNCASYIQDAIDSILNQTFADFEFIIIDDASTDGTINILKRNTDSRIRFVFKDINQGVSSATNEGFRLAKGKYIARMDGDDISLKNRFERQIAILENNRDILVCGSFVKYLGGSNKIIKYKERHNEIISQLLISCSICMGASMFRRNEIKGFFYDDNKSSGEDYDFWTKIAWLGKFHNIQEVLLLYRVHNNQASRKYKEQQIFNDVDIRLCLFKKLNYNSDLYSDKLIKKLLLLKQSFSIKEFRLFLNWMKILIKLNNDQKVYPKKEFEVALKQIRISTLNFIYFQKTNIGIDKLWRLTTLFYLDRQDFLYVFYGKIRETKKRFIKKLGWQKR